MKGSTEHESRRNLQTTELHETASTLHKFMKCCYVPSKDLLAVHYQSEIIVDLLSRPVDQDIRDHFAPVVRPCPFFFFLAYVLTILKFFHFSILPAIRKYSLRYCIQMVKQALSFGHCIDYTNQLGANLPEDTTNFYGLIKLGKSGPINANWGLEHTCCRIA